MIQKLKNFFNLETEWICFCNSKVFFPRHCFLIKKLQVNEYQQYEQENVNLIKFLLSKSSSEGSFFFDVGANIGLISLSVLESCNQCTVVSFEPSPNSFKYLRRTHASSPFRKRWRLEKKALGGQSGKRRFSLAPERLGAYDGFEYTGRMPFERTIIVPVTTIDIEWELLGKPKIAVIKIDVEGAEIEILKGATRCISEIRPYILLEWNNKNLSAYNYHPELLLEFTKSYGYQIYDTFQFSLVTDAYQLNLQMQSTESFVLIPSELNLIRTELNLIRT